MRTLAVVVFVAGLVVLAMPKPEAQTSAPLFVGGQDYIVVWECYPQGCWQERLHVQGVRRDGWVVVRDEQGKEWTINPARAQAITLARPPMLASR